MTGQFKLFDIALAPRGRRWSWCVCTSDGTTIVSGREGSRAAARYKAARALFLLLLSASYQSTGLEHSNKRSCS